MRMTLHKFRKRLRKKSVFNGQLLKQEVQYFYDIISNDKPMMNNFFKDMNSIFGIRQVLDMDNYIYFLKKYGNDTTVHIGQRTRNVLEFVIFYRFYKQTEEIQQNIKLQFQLVMIEYMERHKKNR